MKHGKIYKPDSIEHIMDCDEYSSLRCKYNLDNESDLVDYLAKIVEMRNELF